jgi:hypothetical protein
MPADPKICFRLFTREVEAAMGRRLNLPDKAKLADAFRANLEPSETGAWLSYKLQPAELASVIRKVVAARKDRRQKVDDRRQKAEPLRVFRRRTYLERLAVILGRQVGISERDGRPDSR